MERLTERMDDLKKGDIVMNILLGNATQHDFYSTLGRALVGKEDIRKRFITASVMTERKYNFSKTPMGL